MHQESTGIDADSVLSIVHYFDDLTAKRSSVEAIARAAASLTRCSVGVIDTVRHISVFAAPDGTTTTATQPRLEQWLSAALTVEGDGIVWIENDPRDAKTAVVLDRLVHSIRAVYDRTQQRVVRNDAADLELLLNGAVAEDQRAEAARRLGWGRSSMVEVYAIVSDEPIADTVEIGRYLAAVRAIGSRPASIGERAGLGTPVPIVDAWRSWSEAKTAVRFGVSITPAAPVPDLVRFEELGILAELTKAFDEASEVHPDVLALRRAESALPWVYDTLLFVVTNSSLRSAAAQAHMHHSTMQDRVARIEEQLGWSISLGPGRIRTQVALLARMFRRDR